MALCSSSKERKMLELLPLMAPCWELHSGNYFFKVDPSHFLFNKAYYTVGDENPTYILVPKYWLFLSKSL